VSYTPPANYGDKKALADAGLATKESPVTGTKRMVLPTGRPSKGGAAAPAAPQAPGPGPADVALMHSYAQAEATLQKAQQTAAMPGAGAWAQTLVQLATQARDEAAYQLHSQTPNFALTEG
jgi:hypothetical protein